MENNFVMMTIFRLFLVTVLCIHLAYGDCPALPSVANGTPDINPSFTQGSTVEYVCDLGYEFRTEESDTYSIECQTDDTWTPITDCEAVECPVLPADASLDSTANTYQSTVVMSCTDMVNERIEGVPVGQTLTLTCQANKTWDYWDDSDTTACIPVACVYPMEDATGDVAGTPLTVPPGTPVTFTCDTSHFFIDGGTVRDFTCNSDALWEDDVTSHTNWSCIPEVCSPDLYDVVDNIQLVPDTQFVGDNVKIACLPGHEYNDSSIQKFSDCQANQTWSYIPFSCIPKLCDPVVNMSNVNISTFDNWYPTEVNYTCQTGYFFPDGSLSRVSTCNKYGKWSEVIPQCIDTPLDIETNFTAVVEEAAGAQSYGIIAYVILGSLGLAIVVLDIITFPRQIGFFKRNLRDRCECLQDEEEVDDLESLDGDALMRASSVSLGRGRITPAASTVDLQYGEKSLKSQLNTLQDVEVINEEGEGAKVEEPQGRKNIIPRTRLMSAKTSIQRAMQTAINVTSFKRNLSAKQKNTFTSAALPLGQENYGKVIEMRPPSPEKELPESDSESEYETDSEEETEEAKV